MSKDNTLFYCLGVILVFLLISFSKSRINDKNSISTTVPDPKPSVTPPKNNDGKDTDKTEPSPAPSVPGNNGSGGLAGTVVKPPSQSSSSGRKYSF